MFCETRHLYPIYCIKNTDKPNASHQQQQKAERRGMRSSPFCCPLDVIVRRLFCVAANYSYRINRESSLIIDRITKVAVMSIL